METQVLYNRFWAGHSTVGLFSNPFFSPPLFGNFSAFFHTDFRDPIPVSLVQTGTIPADAQSLRFRTSGLDAPDPTALSFEFAGMTLDLYPLIVGWRSYWGADVSAARGMSGELQIVGSLGSSGSGINVLLDDLTFSSEPVPEPSVGLLLAIIGAATWLFMRSSSHDAP